jgi:hypothetical protein
MTTLLVAITQMMLLQEHNIFNVMVTDVRITKPEKMSEMISYFVAV